MAEGALETIVQVLETTRSADVVKNSCWVISNVARRSPRPPFALVKSVLSADRSAFPLSPALCFVLRINSRFLSVAGPLATYTTLAEPKPSY